MARIVSPGPSDLTKKRATFGPCARRRRHAGAAAVASNPSQLLEITLFFTGCDPASAQLCLDRPRTPAARQRLVSALNSLGFSAQPVSTGQGISSLATRPSENSRSPHKFQIDNGRRTARVRSTHREGGLAALTAFRLWPRRWSRDRQARRLAR